MKPKTPKILNAHAKRRAEERYGINLNKEARHEIVQAIQSNRAEFVAKQSNNRSLWKVSYQDESLNVVYDKQRGTLCTVLPRDAAEFQGNAQLDGPPPTKESVRKQITRELADLWNDEG